MLMSPAEPMLRSPFPLMSASAALPDRAAPSAASAQQHVTADRFSVFYRQNAAVKDVSLAIPRGRITAIIGPSGCGKSTLLRAINRMNDLIPGCHTTGRLLLEDEDIYGAQIDVTLLRKRVGMVFQKPNPFPKSVFDNVAYGPRIHGVRRGELAEVVERSLQKAALWDEVKDRLADSALSLSGGQQQRLCIARALAVEPELLLMDEPTSALDPMATDRIENLMAELRGNYTIIIVTHNMQQAARVSDMTGFFYLGKLIEYSATDKIFTRPDVKQTEDHITGRIG